MKMLDLDISSETIRAAKVIVLSVLAMALFFPALKYFFPCTEGGVCPHVRSFFSVFLASIVANLIVYLHSKKKPHQ